MTFVITKGGGSIVLWTENTETAFGYDWNLVEMNWEP